MNENKQGLVLSKGPKEVHAADPSKLAAQRQASLARHFVHVEQVIDNAPQIELGA